VDPRLNSTASIQLASLVPNTSLPLPLTVATPPTWIVPTQTSSVSVSANATLPIMFDFGPYPGDPDIASSPPGPGPLCADTESASYTPVDGTATAGAWFAEPSECGPYPAGAPAGTLNSVNMTVQTKQFDSTVTSDTGDFWLASTNPATPFSPVIIKPGDSAVINVTITPSGAKNTKVQGVLYVDDYVSGVPPYGQFAGDELAALPYAYMIK